MDLRINQYTAEVQTNQPCRHRLTLFPIITTSLVNVGTCNSSRYKLLRPYNDVLLTLRDESGLICEIDRDLHPHRWLVS